MSKDLNQWLQDNPGMKARYDAAPAEARRMLELWATLDAAGKPYTWQAYRSGCQHPGGASSHGCGA